MTTSEEHRWGMRVPADVSVVIAPDGQMRGVGRLSTVSLSGALLTTTLEVPLHTNLSISLIGDPGQPVDIHGCVVRTQPGSVAIEWRDMASPQVVALIERVSSDTTGLETRDPCAA